MVGHVTAARQIPFASGSTMSQSICINDGLKLLLSQAGDKFALILHR